MKNKSRCQRCRNKTHIEYFRDAWTECLKTGDIITHHLFYGTTPKECPLPPKKIKATSKEVK